MTRQEEKDIMLLMEYGNKYYCMPELICDFGFWRSQDCDVAKSVFESIKDWERKNANSTG